MAALQTQLAGLKLPDLTALQTQIAGAIKNVADGSSNATIGVLQSYGAITAVTPDEQAAIEAQKSSIESAADAAIASEFSKIDLSSLASLQTSLTDISTLSSQLMGSMDVLTGSLYNPKDTDLTNPKTLANAIIALSMGADSLDSGASGLENGVSDLSAASAKIEDAITQFKSGSDTLSQKSGELDSGMKKFKTEGVDEINKDNLTNDLDTAMQIKDAMQQQADAFTSYSGAPDGVKNSIRFIMKTDGIETQKAADAQTAQTQKEEGVWDKITGFFKGIFNIK